MSRSTVQNQYKNTVCITVENEKLSSISHHRTIIQEQWLQRRKYHLARCLVKIDFAYWPSSQNVGKDYGKRLKESIYKMHNKKLQNKTSNFNIFIREPLLSNSNIYHLLSADSLSPI